MLLFRCAVGTVTSSSVDHDCHFPVSGDDDGSRVGVSHLSAHGDRVCDKIKRPCREMTAFSTIVPCFSMDSFFADVYFLLIGTVFSIVVEMAQ